MISDSGDNPGGGSGDVTWTLTRLRDAPAFAAEEGLVAYVASIFDATAVDALFALDAGDPDAGRIAIIRRGGLRVIVAEHRNAYHSTDDFAAIGLDPAAADVIVTKIGYLESTLYDVARGWTLVFTPGPVDQDLGRLGHTRIRRPMFPFDVFEGAPDLTARVFG
ncbi:MlrC C-terminal domain-containing protein [Microbacterium nanhaiense]|uniref:MlrC C-terminal domain-containing protein n=1 Tax=Microbacterium nanhaiense TaxID=1301026 RepID=UPI00227AA850|nr:MlrC C-terminal domain-containing protein [Microbacterium nanhaiense]